MTDGRQFSFHVVLRSTLFEPLKGGSRSKRMQGAILPSSLRYGNARLHDELLRRLLFLSLPGTTRSMEQVVKGGLDGHDGIVGWRGKQHAVSTALVRH